VDIRKCTQNISLEVTAVPALRIDVRMKNIEKGITIMVFLTLLRRY
jgi:hypothetical protein